MEPTDWDRTSETDETDETLVPERHSMVLVVAPGLSSEGSLPDIEGEDWRLHRGDEGQWIVQLKRASGSFKDALLSAIREVQANGFVVLRVEPDDLVTQSEIAHRLGRTNESIRLLSIGRRRKGTFPQPAARTTGRGSLWRWAQVAAWAKRPPEEVTRAELIAVVNIELQRSAYVKQGMAGTVHDVDEAIGASREEPPLSPYADPEPPSASDASDSGSDPPYEPPPDSSAWWDWQRSSHAWVAASR